MTVDGSSLNLFRYTIKRPYINLKMHSKVWKAIYVCRSVSIYFILYNHMLLAFLVSRIVYNNSIEFNQLYQNVNKGSGSLNLEFYGSVIAFGF